MGKTLGLAAVAGSLIAWNWMRLQQSLTLGQIALIVLLAIAPALVQGARARLAASVAAFLVAGASAFALDLGIHYPGRLLAGFGDGFADFYDVKVPFDASAHPNMHGAILLGVFVFTLAAALAIAARRPRPAALALLVGAGWPATLLSGSDYVRGAAILAGLLALLTGLSERRRGLALATVAGLAVVVVALAASHSPALARGQLLDWQSWDFSTHLGKPVDVSYVWSSDYSGLTFPHKVTVVLRIKAPDKPQYWRATELSTVVDGRWLEETAPQVRSSGYLSEPRLVVPRAEDRSNWVDQRVTVEGLRDIQMTAAEVPVQVEAPWLGGVLYDPVGTGFRGHALKRGDVYRAWSYEPQPTPRQLARSRPRYPQVASVQRKYLEVEQRVWVAPFGTPGREQAIERLFTTSAHAAQLKPYLPLYRRAQSVAGDAKSPYAAVVALESWFRSGGTFIYDPHPPSPGDRPALVDFVTRTKSGYCQHFAGAMTLMLRYLGVPARVAAGFTSGHYNDGEWVVTDHDAHEWVEVWFRGWGWVPFDPTPGRGRLSGGYSTSSKGFDLATAALILAGKEGLASFARRRVQLGFPQQGPRFFADPRLSLTPGVPATPSRGRSSGAPGLLQLLALVLVGIVALLALLKLAVRRARYLTRDPRRLAAACHRELRDVLLDQRIDVPSSITVSELATLASAELGVETAGVGRHATVARFGPPVSAREAARELPRAMRTTRRSLRTELSRVERGRGLLSLRSLGLA